MIQQPRTWQGVSDTSQAGEQHKCLAQLTGVSCNHKIVKLDVHHDLPQDRNREKPYVPRALQCRQWQARCQVPLAGCRGEDEAMPDSPSDQM